MKLPYRVLIQLAAKAHCDPRTIDRVAQGAPSVGHAGLRALRALRAAGYEVPDLQTPIAAKRLRAAREEGGAN